TRNARKGRAVVLTTLSGDIEDAPRIVSGIGELDRATGGGFVRGSALLVGGDPGIGKSTLLTQAAAALASKGHRIVYVSGEEAVA
ncbi:MAG: DNA repair protein RadA, partial [Mesorhizobium sp.]